MPKTPRAYRVSEQIREVIASEILRSSDPRLEMVSITSVTSTADLKEAYVYWSVLEKKDKIPDVEAAFESGKGRLRSLLAKKLDLRTVPNLRFFYDDTFDTIDQVEDLMKKVAEKEGQHE